jgi:hypothetical protein
MNNVRVSVALGLIASVCGCGSASSDKNSGSADGGGALPADASGPVADAVANGSGSDTGSPGGDATLAVTGADGSAIDYDQVAPTPASSWVDVTGNLVGISSECGNTSTVFSDPRADRLIVGIALNGLYATTDGATTWNSLGSTGAPIKNRMIQILFDPSTAGTFWEAGIYGFETSTPGVFKTTDNGASFTGNAGLNTMNETNDSVAIDFTDPARSTMLAGTHEQTGVLFLSTNAGAAWTNIGAKLPSGIGFCTQALVLDASTFVVGCANSYSNNPGGVIRSTDGGQTFTTVSSTPVLGAPLHATDGTIYFGIEGGGVLRSTDDGVTWTTVAASSVVASSITPIELPDGRIATANGSAIVVSADQGAHWAAVSPAAPITPIGIAYSPFRRAFYASYFTCNSGTGTNPVPANAIVRYGWDYEAPDSGK